MASSVIDIYLGGHGQCIQYHLSVWMDLCSHRSELDHRGFEECTLKMVVTTALNTRRGWRYVELMEFSWRMAVFADTTAITVVFARPEMNLTLDVLYSATWISLTTTWVDIWWNPWALMLEIVTSARASWVAASDLAPFPPGEPVPAVEGCSTMPGCSRDQLPWADENFHLQNQLLEGCANNNHTSSISSWLIISAVVSALLVFAWSNTWSFEQIANSDVTRRPDAPLY